MCVQNSSLNIDHQIAILHHSFLFRSPQISLQLDMAAMSVLHEAALVCDHKHGLCCLQDPPSNWAIHHDVMTARFGAGQADPAVSARLAPFLPGLQPAPAPGSTPHLQTEPSLHACVICTNTLRSTQHTRARHCSFTTSATAFAGWCVGKEGLHHPHMPHCVCPMWELQQF